MVGLPTNTNMYLPLADSPSIRKVSLVNFSNDGYELSLNGPAFIMLDMSDLGMSYDIESIGSGIVSRKLKEKDITLKVAINYKPDSTGAPVSGATIYDGLTFFLSKLRNVPDGVDRRGCNIKDIPDLCLKWDVPTKNNGVTSRYRDIVITDIQWTEVDKQIQAIIVDLTIKPLGPWYYRFKYSYTGTSNMYFNSNTSSFTNWAYFRELGSSYAKEDMDLSSPFRYGVHIKPRSMEVSSAYGLLEFGSNINSMTQAFYAYLTTMSSDLGVYFGNLRGTPYIINGEQNTSQNLLPGSPTDLMVCTEGYNANVQFKLRSSVTMGYDLELEYDIPIMI